ncbi:MAG: peptide chain release factor N(5)-glutamine methyltransferase [Cyanobacteriota bacterium]|nr:peptide chain release factor N(5)-glutamine methyltransferase [Cyanobacteriota bacterium]
MSPVDSSSPVAEHPPSAPECLPVSDFFSWRRELQHLGGEPGAFDWLLDVAAGISAAHLNSLLLHPSATLTLKCPRRELERLWRLHLLEAVPLQYLLGRCYWREFALDVGPGVLIPRPETEAMIDLAKDLVSVGRETIPAAGFLWADLGTGSGCLAMGLAREFLGSQGLAVDLSPAALSHAHRNLRGSGLHDRVRLIQGDWFGAIKHWWGRLELVLANPPYIPSALVDRLDPVVRDHEPRLALDGGDDGLASIRSLAKDAPSALAPGGWLLLEHHHDQSEAVIQILDSHGLVDLHSHVDLVGHRRYVRGRRPSEAAPSASVGSS